MKHDALHLLRPAEGAVVPLLNARQKAFLDLPREARVAGFLDPGFRIALRDGAGCAPAPVRLEWEGGAAADGPRPVYTVEVRRRPDGTPVFRADTVGTSVEVDNLEIARDYEWTVHANALGHGSATGTFRTEDRAPRLIRADAVPNVRDLGGRVGLGGRRVRQGLVFRSAAFDGGATTRYLSREEVLARSADPRALLDAEAAFDAEAAALAALRERPEGLSLVAGLPRRWTVFRVAEAAFAAEGDAALRALRGIPETLLGAPAEEADLGEDADFAFSEDARDAAAGPAVFLCEAEFAGDGWCPFGCGADWFWDLRIDGEIVYDRSGGNDVNPVETSNHVFVAPVRRGRHLVAAVVRSGSVAWRWRCRTAPPEPVDRLLAGKIANDKDRVDRLFVVPDGFIPGASRIDDGNRSFWLDTLGIRTDLDLRRDDEVRGLSGSPLGPTVAWVNVAVRPYEGLQNKIGREAFAEAFRVFLDPASYPVDIHCAGGADRTGSLAFVLNALLGVGEEELSLDWEVTAFHSHHEYFQHGPLYGRLVEGFDRFPGATIRERVEAYILDLGFTRDDIATLRDILLEPAP